VAQNLIGTALRAQFVASFPSPEDLKRSKGENPYEPVVRWFGAGNRLDVQSDLKQDAFVALLNSVPGLEAVVGRYLPKLDPADRLFWMEFVLHALAEFSLIGRNRLERGVQFQDLMSGLFSGKGLEDDDEGDWEDEEDDDKN
jgi:magnesium chelatase subunit I